jgi:pSer/pThr/pTyr-binding forkhead associated (FHA) protein
MEKLILLSEDGISQEFPLIEQMTSIGREEHNHICLSDKSVSRHHATLQRVYKGFTLQDEESTNGTRINGRLITKQFLKHRDLIEIGKYHLRFLVSEPDQEVTDSDKTVVLGSPKLQQESAAPAETPPAPATVVKPTAFQRPLTKAPQPKPKPKSEPEEGVEEAETGAKVVYLAGEKKGLQVVVDRAFFSVGEPDGDLVLINKRKNGYFLLKVGGDAPPTINGTPIKAGGVELRDRDRIDLGVLSLEFRI